MHQWERNVKLFVSTHFVALSKHPERPPRDQPLRGEPELPAGPGGPHPGGQQQQLQRDLCLHAHSQSGHDHRQQAERVTSRTPTEAHFSVSILLNMYLFPFFGPAHHSIHIPSRRTLLIQAVRWIFVEFCQHYSGDFTIKWMYSESHDSV